jgi:U3 small nucleolar RNA-associated protein 18
MSDMPILRCEFTTDGQQAIAAGRRKYFYVYDTHSGALQKVSGLIGRQEKSLEDFVISPNGEFIAFLGNDGHVLLVSARSKQLVGSVRMNTRVLAACFSPDGRELLTAGLGNEVFRWDLGTRKCVHRFVYDGALRCCALAYSPDGQFIATGAESGVVNIYDAVGLCARQSRSPKPVRSLPHLVNEVCDLRFDNTSQLLSLVSRQAREALKLVHVPSFSVYSNWPTTKTPLGYVSAVDFSPSSGFMTIGNDKGRALLYRLNHFTKY